MSKSSDKFHVSFEPHLPQGKYNEELCEKIHELADMVDLQSAKHSFATHYVTMKDKVKARFHDAVYERQSFWKRLLRAPKKLKSPFKEINDTKLIIKRSIFETLNVEDVIARVALRSERKKAIKEKTHTAFDSVKGFFERNFITPFKEVTGASDLAKKVADKRASKNQSPNVFKILFSNVASFARVVALFALIFTGTFVTLNIEAFSTVASDYLQNNSLFSPYFEKQELVEEFVEENTLTQAPNEVKAAVDEKEQFESNALDLLPLNLAVMPDQNRLYIPKINKNIPIANVADEKIVYTNDYRQIEDQIQEALRDGVVRYPGTAKPGEQGNVSLTGHSSYYLLAPGDYKDVFALLHKVQLDDEIIVYYGEGSGNQKKYTYKVTEIKEVKPSQVDVLKQTDDYRLTLITCTPIGTTLRRLVVTAIQVDEE